MRAKGSLSNNILYSICYQLLILFLPLITAPYISRVLGVKAVGIYSYTQAFANYFYLFAMLGVNKYGVREIARVRDDGDRLRTTFWSIYCFQAALALLVILFYAVYVLFFIKENQLFYLLQVFYVLSAAFDANWACFGLERFKLTTIRSMAVRVASTAAIFLLVRGSSDLWIYTLILSLGFLIAALSIWPFLLREIPFMRPTLSDIIRHIRPNVMMFWPVLAVSIYNLMDKLMLGRFSSEEVGYYANAERIVHIPNALLLAIENSIMPRMSNLYVKGTREESSSMLNTVMLVAMALGSAMAFGMAAIGKTFAPWFYGESFARCGLFIAYLSPVILFKAWAGALRTQYIIPAGRDRLYLTSLISGAIVNLVLNCLLIPGMLGLGAIIGTLAAEGTVAVIQFVMCRGELPIMKFVKAGLGFVVVGAVMYLTVVPFSIFIKTPVLCMLLQTVTGIVEFAIGVFLLSVLTRRENGKTV